MVFRAHPLRFTLPALAVGLSVALSACGGSDAASTTETGSGDTTATTVGGAAASAGTNIIIKDFVFKPEDLAAKVGDTITVKNDDSAAHTVTAQKGGGFDTGNLGDGDTKTFTLDKAGTFTYRCDIHNYMTGSITVT